MSNFDTELNPARNPSSNWRKGLLLLGPGFITAATILGPGSITVSSSAGGLMEYSVLWGLVIAISATSFSIAGAAGQVYMVQGKGWQPQDLRKSNASAVAGIAVLLRPDHHHYDYVGRRARPPKAFRCRAPLTCPFNWSRCWAGEMAVPPRSIRGFLLFLHRQRRLGGNAAVGRLRLGPDVERQER
ncbi:hypothetical protein WJ0W_000790 [Paenibacillus melissococcoides]|uniref:Uncharacterized protein n=1 Tax=Paenibacillus melissococcoides TaxID=2912268 RepID=A0ABN8U220_9BACL|nr:MULTISPECIES: hypothetical protein [Paenibacillus]MEB9897789.1 hypothetical protein [Bacillus cereus]CAH8243550.1 hypothetical protein WJ0W_000790 [Paenibacillus melissococcoides]CAH8704842.1 hypothetical protein WDD9_000776 [Paenibacillus melissococcoides]CAH8708067.1 hypothetical protein HTL2_001862 [Paenibacillus melissococcoides]